MDIYKVGSSEPGNFNFLLPYKCTGQIYLASYHLRYKSNYIKSSFKLSKQTNEQTRDVTKKKN